MDPNSRLDARRPAGGPGGACGGSDSTGGGGDVRAALRQRIVATARSALGTPFKHQGRQPGVGLDCVGLVIWVGNALGLTRLSIANYPRLPKGDRLLCAGEEAGFTAVEAPLPGDVACFRLERDPQHVAILTDRGAIHACQARGRVVEHRLDAVWRGRIVSVFRYPGV